MGEIFYELLANASLQMSFLLNGYFFCSDSVVTGFAGDSSIFALHTDDVATLNWSDICDTSATEIISWKIALQQPTETEYSTNCKMHAHTCERARAQCTLSIERENEVRSDGVIVASISTLRRNVQFYYNFFCSCFVPTSSLWLGSNCALERESFSLYIARANNTKSYRMKNISFINFEFPHWIERCQCKHVSPC